MARWLTNTSPGLERFWHPVAFVDEVTDTSPHRVELLGRRWVLVRRPTGELGAFHDECPHRRASLATGCVVDGTLQCPYHGWRFAFDGSCVEIPATGGGRIPQRANLYPAHAVQEHAGLIWIAVDEPLVGLPEWPEWDQPDWDTWYLDRRNTTASAGLLTENFLDATHFAFVHRSTFGADSPSVGVTRMKRSGWTMEAGFDQTTWQPGLGATSAEVTTQLTGPFCVRITIAAPGGSRSFTFFLQPAAEHQTRLFLGVGASDTAGDAQLIEEESAFNDRVYDEDLAVLEEFADPRLPLDLRMEVHTSADSHLVEYRRLLGEVASRAALRESTIKHHHLEEERP